MLSWYLPESELLDAIERHVTEISPARTPAEVMRARIQLSIEPASVTVLDTGARCADVQRVQRRSDFATARTRALFAHYQVSQTDVCPDNSRQTMRALLRRDLVIGTGVT